MKRAITTLWLALASTAVLAEAEQPATSAAQVKQSVAVTAEQKQQIKALVEAGETRQAARTQVLTKEQLVNVSSHRAMKSARQESVLYQLGLSDEQRAKISQIRAEGGNRKDVRGVLTAEQAAKYDELRRVRKEGKDKSHKEGKKKKDEYQIRGE